MNPRKIATMNDVAREAGVSRAAVSKVIRNAYGVSPAMRERVESAVRRLGYRPSLAARAIRGASRTIGFQLHELENPALARILSGAARGIDGSGFQLIVAPARTSGENEGYHAVEALADLHVDGIVVVAPLIAVSWLEELAAKVPVVMLARHDHTDAYDTITGDDAAGTGLAMNHLLELGHRKISHLTLGEQATGSGLGTPHAVRLATYLQLMKDRDLDSMIRIDRTGPSESEAHQVARSMLESPDRPTAIFAGNDALALGALRARQELDLSSGELSIVGYDDIPMASHPGISLTTVDQPGDELGEQAVRLLLERIAGRAEARHESTAPQLRIRSSTAPLIEDSR